MQNIYPSQEIVQLKKLIPIQNGFFLIQPSLWRKEALIEILKKEFKCKYLGVRI